MMFKPFFFQYMSLYFTNKYKVELDYKMKADAMFTFMTLL